MKSNDHFFKWNFSVEQEPCNNICAIRDRKKPTFVKRGMLRTILFLAFLLSSIILSAQVNVRGKVVDTTGESLIGVNVVIKDSRQGTVTDIDGNFSLEVPSLNNTLVFSYVGYAELEVPLNGRNWIEVTMSQDTELLDEIVVVGYGTQRRAS